MSRHDGSPWRWLLLSALLLCLDQWSKYWVSQHLLLFQSRILIPGCLSFTLLHNTGAAFSFLYSAGGWQRWLFATIAIGVSTGLLWWLWRLPRQLLLLPGAISLILGGATGNLLDRLRLSYVVDFVHVYYKDWHFPAFNLADSAITVGTVLLLIDMFFFEEHRHG